MTHFALTRVYEISVLRHRFALASEALEAALAFECGHTDFLDYEITYSEGDQTETSEADGWSVEVMRVNPRDRLGNLAPKA
jgi:hypothetical protein